jgi:hypothetical protein
MTFATGISASWTGANLWQPLRKSPQVVVLAGIESSEIVEAALCDTALTDAIVPRFEAVCTPPCDALLWRLETAAGESLNTAGLLRRYWHRRPYAITIRLIQYQPGSVDPVVLDEGTIGTRGAYLVFKAAVDRLAMRFVRDAALGRGRGPAEMAPAAAAHGLPGWMDHLRARWHSRVMTEWWSLGSAKLPLDRVVSGLGLGDIIWYNPKAGQRYLADPFPWPGTDRILCEEMPLSGGVGRIVAVAEKNGALTAASVVLDDAHHHSYPCTLQDGETIYCVPESTERGATRICRLDDDGRLTTICTPAPYARLADPTLFRWNGRYWLACTDLDLGHHDNLCLLHAPAVTGPWTAHARWPVKIDVRGARPAGRPFVAGNRLFRVGQDCAATYGAGVAVHEVLSLTETDFRESLITVLRPDKTGPFPHGLHTLVHDGQRFWVDGKRFVLDFKLFRQKLLGRAFRMFSMRGVG